MNSIKRLVDGKIRKSIIDGNSIDYAISVLKSDSERFGKCIIDQNINKQSKRYEYIQIYILWANNRINDLEHMKKLSNRFKFDNNKLFKLIEFKTNYGESKL